MNKFRGISGKLIISVGTLLIIACTVLGVLSYMTSASALQKQTEEALANQAKDIRLYIEESFGRIQDRIEALAIHPEIMNVSERLTRLINTL